MMDALWSMKRTDLAVEARDMFIKENNSPVEGLLTETLPQQGLLIERVEIVSDKAAAALCKPVGRYVTLSLTDEQGGWLDTDMLEQAVAEELRTLLSDFSGTVLVVGLGNRAITADSLGPRTLDEIVVTRHLAGLLQESVRGRLNYICSAEPGVFGVTGIETAEVIGGLVQQIKPAAVIAVDALAAASTSRLNTTVQIADTGIHPGSGIDNKRYGLNKATLGVPVVAVGIPTVVHASTIALDMINIMEQQAAFSRYFKSLENLNSGERRRLFRELLPEFFSSLVVSPKEADILLERMGRVLAEGINRAVYGDFDYLHLENYLQ